MDKDVLMICDGEKAVGIAGIMGGENSMITDGCRIDGEVEHSVLFAGVKVAPGAVVKDAVVMGGYRDQTGCSGRTLYYW